MDICSLPTLFLRCSVALPSLLIIVSILFGFFYYWFVVNRQIDLESMISQSARDKACQFSCQARGRGTRLLVVEAGPTAARV